MAPAGALTIGLVTLERPPAPLRDPVRKETGAGNEFFQLLPKIKSQAQGKGRESCNELNELLACQRRRQPGLVEAWPLGSAGPAQAPALSFTSW